MVDANATCKSVLVLYCKTCKSFGSALIMILNYNMTQPSAPLHISWRQRCSRLVYSTAVTVSDLALLCTDCAAFTIQLEIAAETAYDYKCMLLFRSAVLDLGGSDW